MLFLFTSSLRIDNKHTYTIDTVYIIHAYIIPRVCETVEVGGAGGKTGSGKGLFFLHFSAAGFVGITEQQCVAKGCCWSPKDVG